MSNGPLFADDAFENPELAAMAAIADRLRALPDDAARLRVMRWAFGRFSSEFKRPVENMPAPAVQAATPASAQAPATVVRMAIPVPAQVAAPAAAAPGVAAAQGVSVSEDFRTQISELNDLFPERPLATTVDGFPDYAAI